MSAQLARPRIGFLGLGAMGGPIARRLVQVGFSVTGYVLAGDFTPHFSIALSRKDLSLALQMAESLGVPMLATATVRQIYETAAAQGLDTLDMAGVTTLYEQWAGVKVRTKR